MITTRPWIATDTFALEPMMLDLLASTSDLGADLLPSAHNALTLLDLGMQWSGKGEPTLVACDGQKIVGFILWGNAGNPLKLDVRGPICTAMGTYVLPDYRRKHIALRLRQEATEMAWSRGYAKIAGAAYHDAGILSAQHAGFRPVGALLEARP